MSRTKLRLRFKGGPGSGHHGHRGRPGKRGGSLPGTYSNWGDPSTWKLIGKASQGVSGARFFQTQDGTKLVVKQHVESHPYASGYAEVETYTVAQELGYNDLVPETQMVMIEGKQFTAQKMITGNVQTYAETEWNEASRGNLEDFKRIAVLDIVTGNSDRHDGNLLYNKDTGQVWAIDNDRTFNSIGYPISSYVMRVGSSWEGNVDWDYRPTTEDGTPLRSFRLSRSDLQPALNLMNNSDFQSRIEKVFGAQRRYDLEGRALALEEYMKGLP